MRYQTRIYYTEADKALMWERWQKGDSLQMVAQMFGRNHSSVAGILVRTGGIRPPPRRRSRLALTLSEREEVSLGIAAGGSIRSIAERVGRSASTICREINRNGGREHYRANVADQAAWDWAHRPKVCKLVQNRQLARIVAGRLKELWSPAQIAGWLKKKQPHDERFQVSHETIYRSLYIQARGALDSCSTSGVAEPCVARDTIPKKRRTTGEYAMPSLSANGHLLLRIVQFRGIGRAT